MRKTLLVFLSAFQLASRTAAMSNDLYPDFQSMKEARKEGEDYGIRFEDRKSSVTVFAIHGGNIEPGTSQAALAVAGSDWNYYLFECLGTFKECRKLHVTASHYDDPVAVALATSSLLSVALHGARDTEPFVCVGGPNPQKRAPMAARRLSSKSVSDASPARNAAVAAAMTRSVSAEARPASREAAKSKR